MSTSLCELDTSDPMDSFVNTLLMLKNASNVPALSETKNFEIVSPSRSHDSESESFTSNKRPRLSEDDSASLSSAHSSSSNQIATMGSKAAVATAKDAKNVVSLLDLAKFNSQIYQDTQHLPQHGKNSRGKYRCGRCGLPKTNHVCSVESKFIITYCATTQCEPLDTTLSSFNHYRTITARPRNISPSSNAAVNDS